LTSDPSFEAIIPLFWSKVEGVALLRTSPLYV